jgi:hypothetical protein
MANGLLSGRLTHAVFHPFFFLSFPFPIKHPEDEWNLLYNVHNFIANTFLYPECLGYSRIPPEPPPPPTPELGYTCQANYGMCH